MTTIENKSLADRYLYTIFQTPGEFDLRSLDTFGMNAKPNSRNPIGYFGTGLKYAIAVLLNTGCKIDLYCNGNHYKFYTKRVDFRGSQFDQVYTDHTNAFVKMFGLQRKELPFTTELGKNWELWQAFRELYANTLDESGEVYTCDPGSPQSDNIGSNRGCTYIVVESLEFSTLVERRHEIFLDPRREVLIDAPQGNVTEGGSNHIYYRGMRAKDLQEEEKAIFTWNIIEEQELTEDRTLKEDYYVRKSIQHIVEHSTNPQFIKQVLTAPKKSFEGQLDWEFSSPSTTFKEVLTEIRDHKNLNRSASAYYGRYISPPKEPIVSDATWTKIVEALAQGAENCFNDDEIGDYPEREKVDAVYLKAFQEKFER